MKTSTIQKRLDKLTSSKQLSKSSLVYNWCARLATNEKIRPVFSQGSSWKNSSLVDKSAELTTVLDALKIKYTIGNDAPRGGKTGYFVQILTKIS